MFNTVEVTLIIAASALVSAMIADVVEDSEIKTGRRSEGIFFAANSFAQKAVNGLGVVVAGQILAIIQFPTGAKPGEVPSGDRGFPRDLLHPGHFGVLRGCPLNSEPVPH